MKCSSETDLAWTLLDCVGYWIAVGDRHRIHISLGLGDTSAAIRQLLTHAARRGIPVSADIAAAVHLWAQAYRGAPDEPVLTELLGRIQVAPA